MNEEIMFVLSILAFVGLCMVFGVLSRGTEPNEKDRDNVYLTFLRGIAMVCIVFSVLIPIAGLIYLIIDAFS